MNHVDPHALCSCSVPGAIMQANVDTCTEEQSELMYKVAPHPARAYYTQRTSWPEDATNSCKSQGMSECDSQGMSECDSLQAARGEHLI